MSISFYSHFQKTLASLVVLVTFIALAHGQTGADLEQDIAKSIEYFESKKYKEASVLLEKHLETLKMFFNQNPQTAKPILDGLVICYQATGQTQKANELNAFLNSGVPTDDRPWSEITKSGLALLEAGKYSESYEMLKNAMEAAAKSHGKNSNEYATTLFNLSIAARRINRTDEGESYLVEALRLKKALLGDNDRDVGWVHNSLGVLNYDAGRIMDAKGYFEEALRIEAIHTKKKGLNYGASLNNLAEVYSDLGELNKAKKLRLEAVDIIQKAVGNNNLEYARVLRSKAELAITMGELEAAEADLSKSEAIVIGLAGKKHPDYAASLMVKSSLFKASGAFQQNEKILLEALEIKLEVYGDKHPEVGRAYNHLAAYYNTLGDYAKAKSYLISGLVLIAQNVGTENYLYASALTHMATVLEKLGELAEAESHYAESLRIWETYYSDTHKDYLVAINSYGLFLATIGEFEDAEILLTMNLEKRELVYGKKSMQYARALNNLATLYKDKKDYPKAVALQEQNLKLRKEMLGPAHADYGLALANAAYINELAVNLPKAASLYKEAFVIYQKQIEEVFPYLSERERLLYYNTVQIFLQSYIAFTIDHHKNMPELTGALFDMQLALKGLLFRSAEQVTQAVLQSGDQSLVNDFRAWLQKKEQLTKAIQVPQEELLASGLSIDQLRSEAESLEKSISLRSTTYAAMAGPNSIGTWQDVQKSLGANEAAIEIVRGRRYVHGNDTTYLALVLRKEDSQGPRIVVLQNGQSLEGKDIQGYHNAVKFRVDDTRSYNTYWAAIAPLLDGVTRIYFSGDGVYHKLNLNTLKNTASGKFLSEEKEILLVANTRDIVKIKKGIVSALPTKGYYLFGFPNYGQSSGGVPAIDAQPMYLPSGAVVDTTQRFLSREGNISPLPGTKREVEAIASLIAENSFQKTTYMADQATEEAIKRLKNVEVLHIATHGFFLSDVGPMNAQGQERQTLGIERDQLVENPLLRSGLLMAGAEKALRAKEKVAGQEDGIFSAQEAANLYLGGTKLVVLSACETGQGKVSNGEGVFGLPRAFLQAGAETVIMSLWTVSDEVTQLLMTKFYTYWLEGNTKQSAFLKAQSDIRKQYPEPYFWGAFVMAGMP